MTDLTYDLSLIRNAYNHPVSKEYAAKIIIFIYRPSADNWDDIQGIILTYKPMLTIWQAVCQLDPTFPNRGRITDVFGQVIKEWERIPTVEQVREAIAFATH